MDRELSEKKPRDNITRFKQDRRLLAVSLLRTLALLIMLGTVVYGAWEYRDDLRIENLRRLFSYARAAAGSEGDGFVTYHFEPGLETVYAPFDLGLAVVSSDTYRFVTGFSSQGFSAQLGYGNPAMAVGDGQVLVYDRGGTAYSVMSSYAVVHTGTSDSAIIAAAMNPRGDYVLVKEESGYRSGVYVYDRKGHEVCVWQTPSAYVMLPSLSPDGARFAALCMDDKGGQVRVYEAGNEKPLFAVDYGWRQVYAIRHDKNGQLFILCEDGLAVYDTEGEYVGGHPFTGLVRFAHHEGGLPMVALRVNTGGGERVRLIAFGEDGAAVWEGTAQGSLRDMDFRGEYGVVLLYNELYTLDVSGEAPIFRSREVSGVRRALVTARGQGVLVYSDRAEGVDITAEAE